MTRERRTHGPGGYEVGYGKPPSRTRFRKGASGNPGGRPRRMTAGRANSLALKEAYRIVTVREGDKVLTMPAIQAVLRGLVAHAAKGNSPAQRTFIEIVQLIERELAAEAAAKNKAEAETSQISDIEAARRVAFLLNKAAREETAHGTAPNSVPMLQGIAPQKPHGGKTRDSK
jgi:Family of unknown function (DUF5681)